MMNVFALGLLFTSLVTAGFFSPTPEKQNSKENIVLQDGHRFVVEFEKDNGNTKVSISPQGYKGFVENMEDKVSETTEGVKSRLKEDDSAITEEIHRGFSPRELVCDAYGKCKHKIAAAIGRTEDAVAEKAHEVEEEAGEAIGKVNDTVTHSAHRVSDKARESTENVKESAREAKDKVSEKTSEMKEGAAVQAEKAKSHLSEKAKEAEEMVRDASDRVKQGAQRVKEEGRGAFQRARAIGVRVLAFLVPPVSLNSVSGVLHLLGFTAAYGMCIWVTFASSYVLAVALPRHQFGMVQSKIYPVYFKAMAYCVGMALFGHLLSQRKRLSPFSVGMFQASNLVVSLVMILANSLYLEPRATKVMFERMKMEKEEGRGKESGDMEPSGRNTDPTTERGVSSTGGSRGSAEEKRTDTAAAAKAEMVRLSEMLRRLNSYSSFLNVLTLMSLTCHLVYLGQRLHIEC